MRTRIRHLLPVALAAAIAGSFHASPARCRPLLGSGVHAARGLDAPGGAEVRTLSNGLRVEIYDADVLRRRVVTRDGETILPLDAYRYLRVITDIDDPAIANRGDGRFHAFEKEEVLEELERIAHPGLDRLSVTVYLLPYPRREILVSSTSGHEIFLSPHVLRIRSEVTAYIVAHEFGHVVHNAWLPEGDRRWSRYRALRGIDDVARFCDDAPHAYRPREIFAEDFRVLFGGDEAAFGGVVENPELPSPRDVPGLYDWMEALGTSAPDEPEVAIEGFPNPFNPVTRLRVELPANSAGAPTAVDIFDARGARVRTLHRGRATGDVLDLVWDGTDDRGQRVASATYFARVRVGDVARTLKLVLLK